VKFKRVELGQIQEGQKAASKRTSFLHITMQWVSVGEEPSRVQPKHKREKKGGCERGKGASRQCHPWVNEVSQLSTLASLTIARIKKHEKHRSQKKNNGEKDTMAGLWGERGEIQNAEGEKT